ANRKPGCLYEAARGDHLACRIGIGSGCDHHYVLQDIRLRSVDNPREWRGVSLIWFRAGIGTVAV
ncbi:MAG: hypothetical protein VX704_03220, partial [Verrucomicrobiota bacterium]|nr:hypothetical protein [Verrucomicrobiota bacterium]